MENTQLLEEVIIEKFDFSSNWLKIIFLYIKIKACVIHESEDDLGKGGHQDSKTTG